MSFCCVAISAANTAVTMPTHAMTSHATGTRWSRKVMRASRYTPAATIVAAWMSADTGVGPSIASGSQTWSGTCADFPIGPQKMNSVATVR